MAKRFIQHELLRNPWLRAASTLEKLLWVGLITECDHAGIWIVDWQMMELMVGGKIDPSAAKKFLNGRFLEVDNGRRWFLPDFIRFQYPQGVSTNNNTMKSVRQILDNYGIDAENLTLGQGLTKGWSTLDQGLQDKDKDKDMVRDSVSRARQNIHRLLVTEHRGKKIDWYEYQLRDAIEVSTPELIKLKDELGDRYEKRMDSYKSLVLLMVNGDDLGCPSGMHSTVLMLKDQLKFYQYSKLADLAKSPVPIRDVIMAMHNNYAKNVKGKTTVYNTALEWLKRRLDNTSAGEVGNVTKKLSTPKQVKQ